MNEDLLDAKYINQEINNNNDNNNNDNNNNNNNNNDNNNNDNNHVFTHLVLGGGGMMGAVYIGAFKLLYSKPELIKSIKTVIGTSVGAIFGAAFILQIDIDEIELFWKNILDKDTCVYDINIMDFFNIFETLGLDDNKRSMEILYKYIKHLTFRDLAKKTGKELIICATNAYTMEPVYFSVNTTPNVLVYDAIQASCALPLLYKPINIGNMYYVDGGISDNIPIYCIPKNVNYDSILILSLKNKGVAKTDKLELPTLLLNTLMTLLINKTLFILYEKRYTYFVAFENIPIRGVEFITKDDKLFICTSLENLDACIQIGYNTMSEKLIAWQMQH